MPKPDPALLDPARYPFSCTIETRYRDVDSNLHINNGVMASLLEEGRVRYHRESGYNAVATRLGVTMMVASIAIEYIGQSRFPAPLGMHVACADVGRTSTRLAQLVTQDGRPVVFAQSVMVCVKDDQPIEIPADWRDEVRAWMLRP